MHCSYCLERYTGTGKPEWYYECIISSFQRHDAPCCSKRCCEKLRGEIQGVLLGCNYHDLPQLRQEQQAEEKRVRLARLDAEKHRQAEEKRVRLARLDAEKHRQAEDDGTLKGMLAIMREEERVRLARLDAKKRQQAEEKRVRLARLDAKKRQQAEEKRVRLARLDAKKRQQAEDDGALKGMLAIMRDSSICALPLPPGTWNSSLRQHMQHMRPSITIADGSDTIDSTEVVAMQTGETWESAGGNAGSFNGPAVAATFSHAALLSFCDEMGAKVRVTEKNHGEIK